MNDLPDWLEQELPPHGPCGLCGDPDARHRVLDAIHDRVVAGGDGEEEVARDYDLTVEAVLWIAAEWHPKYPAWTPDSQRPSTRGTMFLAGGEAPGEET